MPNKHYQKWIIQMPAGFLLLAAGILVIMYSANKRASDEWLVWGIISVTIINSALGLLGNALIHKVKSDLMQKRKLKKNSTEFEDE
jgi:uncharacterized membrane protein HdeD (DUF308 family)